MALYLLLFICCIGSAWFWTRLFRQAVVTAGHQWSKRFDARRIEVTPEIITRSLTIGFVALTFFCLLLLRSIVLALVISCSAWFVPWIILHVHDYRRRIAFARQFADSLTLIANSLRAGFNLNQAIRIAADELPPPSNQEFDLVVRETELGASLRLALENLARRMPDESMRIFVTAVNVTLRTGGEITKIFDNIATTIRERERVEERVRTLTASGRFQGYGIAALPFVALLLRYLRSPDSMQAFFQWKWGVAIFCVGLVLEIIGLLAIEKICRARV